MKKNSALRLIALMLSLLMLSLAFASCADQDNGDATDSPDATGNASNPGDNDNVVDLDNLDDPAYRRPEYSDFIPLARSAAAEGMVLLKNEDETLPFKKDDTVALVGSAAINTVNSPNGSGISSAVNYSLLDGMRTKAEEGKVSVSSELVDRYATERRYSPSFEEMQKARETSETAVMVISRSIRSGSDNSAQMGGYYLSADEIAMLGNLIKAGFEDIVVVLNVGAVIDMSKLVEIPEVKAILLAWQPGSYGGLAMADILVGDITPSGKLTDTMASSYKDYPSSTNFGKSNEFVEYTEDIFVGYRYFETFDGDYDKVIFEFGFGLSYTTFEYSDAEFEFLEDKIKVSVKVTNTGNFHGKETAQVYVAAPQGELGKPAKELVAFAKTVTLYPGETQILRMEIDMAELASYDDVGKVQKSAFIIEEGDYEFFVGGSVKQAVETGLGYIHSIRENIIVEQLSEQMKARLLKERLLADGSYEDIYSEHEISAPTPTTSNVTGSAPESLILFGELYSQPTLIDSFLAQMSDQSLVYLLYGHPRGEGRNDPSDIASFDSYGVPAVVITDGPAGVAASGVKTTAWPVATALGCTWNVELIEKVAREIGKEAKAAGVDVLRAPSANIHRDPLCGANHEYFSEDPLLTGVMASAFVKGVQSEGVGACLQYLVANERENGRNDYDTRVSERALREIYLRPFEMAVEAEPWMLMTSYNHVNGVETATNYSLITEIVRNEWGYDGVISTEWRNNTDILDEILAGSDLKMPSATTDALMQALSEGKISRALLEERAKRILTLALKTGKGIIDDSFIIFDPGEVETVKSTDFSDKSSEIGLENCEDEGIEQNTSGNDAGRYLSYSIVAKNSSNYAVTVRVASPEGTGAFELYLDGVLVAVFDNNDQTESWQSWVDSASTFVINIPTGMHELKISFTESGLNFSKLTFTPTDEPVTMEPVVPAPEEDPQGPPERPGGGRG